MAGTRFVKTDRRCDFLICHPKFLRGHKNEGLFVGLRATERVTATVMFFSTWTTYLLLLPLFFFTASVLIKSEEKKK